MNKDKITFEYKDLPAGYRAVSLNSKLKDYERKVIYIKGEPKIVIPEMAIKDCRKIDGCVYFAPKNTAESKLNELIELFNKLLLEKVGGAATKAIKLSYYFIVKRKNYDRKRKNYTS